MRKHSCLLLIAASLILALACGDPIAERKIGELEEKLERLESVEDSSERAQEEMWELLRVRSTRDEAKKMHDQALEGGDKDEIAKAVARLEKAEKRWLELVAQQEAKGMKVVDKGKAGITVTKKNL